MKDNFFLPAIIFVVAVGLIAAYMFAVQNGYAAVPDCASTGICSWIIKDDYSQVYRGLLVNPYGATDGLIVANGKTTLGSPTPGTATLNVVGDINVSSGNNIKIGTNNVCLSDGTNCPAAPASVSHGKQRFTANGAFTVPAGVTKVWVSMSGGGGGGGDGNSGIGGGGGGAHAVLAQEVTVTSGENIVVTVGVGGNGDAGGCDGSAGGTSLFGGYISTPGGGGGEGACASAGGMVGGAPGGIGGARGTMGNTSGAGYSLGGGSIFGASGPPGGDFGGGTGYGSGGHGGPTAGGTGAPGFVLVEW